MGSSMKQECGGAFPLRPSSQISSWLVKPSANLTPSALAPALRVGATKGDISASKPHCLWLHQPHSRSRFGLALPASLWDPRCLSEPVPERAARVIRSVASWGLSWAEAFFSFGAHPNPPSSHLMLSVSGRERQSRPSTSTPDATVELLCIFFRSLLSKSP